MFAKKKSPEENRVAGSPHPRALLSFSRGSGMEREEEKKRKPKGKEKVKVTEEKLGGIPDDIATREREDWKEKRKEKEKPKPKTKRKPRKRRLKVKKLKERDRWYMDDRDQILLKALMDPELQMGGEGDGYSSRVH